jgi:hypothetical protein
MLTVEDGEAFSHPSVAWRWRFATVREDHLSRD